MTSIPKVVPAPWTLPGVGYVYATHTPFSPTPIPLPAGSYDPSDLGTSADQSSNFHGGVGLVMLVRYTGGEAGPYDELLLSPGLFKSPKGTFHQSITRIYVSTESSVISGRSNWGIPKHLAHFSFTPLAPQFATSSPLLVRVAHPASPDAPFFQAVLSPGKGSRLIPPVPISTSVISAPLNWATGGAYRAEIVQPKLDGPAPPSADTSTEDESGTQHASNAEGERTATLVGSESAYIVRPKATGWARLSWMLPAREAGEEWAGLGDGVGFPKIGLAVGGMGARMSFTMEFPVPEKVA